MKEKLIVQKEMQISASPETVWEILILPKYVAQWDELPEDYPQDPMTTGSKVIWELPNGEQSITTVIKADLEKELVIDLHGTGWKNKPQPGEIAYRFYLEENQHGTNLSIDIGDFSLLDQGKQFYEASLDFAEEAAKTIKTLAESNEQIK